MTEVQFREDLITSVNEGKELNGSFVSPVELECRGCGRTKSIEGHQCQNCGHDITESYVGGEQSDHDWRSISDGGVGIDPLEQFATCPECVDRVLDGAIEQAIEKGTIQCSHSDHDYHKIGLSPFEGCVSDGYIPLTDGERQNVIEAFEQGRDASEAGVGIEFGGVSLPREYKELISKACMERNKKQDDLADYYRERGLGMKEGLEQDELIQ